MRVWLKQMSVTEVAMESTGVYWKPVWSALEGQGFQKLVLANPQQVKALHGRKSDKRDARRISEFLHDRRLDGSFVPPPEIRELRMLTRLRVSWLEQHNEVHNQIRDLLEASSCRQSVASDIMGVTGKHSQCDCQWNGGESGENMGLQGSQFSHVKSPSRPQDSSLRGSVTGLSSRDLKRGYDDQYCPQYLVAPSFSRRSCCFRYSR